jgi:hypothetical protein
MPRAGDSTDQTKVTQHVHDFGHFLGLGGVHENLVRNVLNVPVTNRSRFFLSALVTVGRMKCSSSKRSWVSHERDIPHGHLPFPAGRNGRAEWAWPLQNRATGDAVAAPWIAPGPLSWPYQACGTEPQRDDVRDMVHPLHHPGSALDQAIIAITVLRPSCSAFWPRLLNLLRLGKGHCSTCGRYIILILLIILIIIMIFIVQVARMVHQRASDAAKLPSSPA